MSSSAMIAHMTYTSVCAASSLITGSSTINTSSPAYATEEIVSLE